MRRLLSQQDESRVIAAIRAAESRTSGEIRVHVERRCAGDPMMAARDWFRRLRMEATRERNGILFYVSVDDRRFAIVGDEGVHAKVGDTFWATLRDDMQAAFAKGETCAGLTRAIDDAGTLLAQHFPRRPDDRNELADEISS